jgi:RNA polymerase sigma-70 factor (ECF subfamily)
MHVADKPSQDAAHDAWCAHRVSLGDPDAERELYRRFFPRVRAFGWRRLRDADAAADLAQHVLLIVIERLKAQQLRDTERIAAYVLGVARNTLLEWHKTEIRRAELLSVAALEHETTGAEPAALPLEQLSECLHRLSPRERLVVTLTFFGERSSAEIARELRMAEGNVRVVRHRALKQLHGCLGAEA